MDINEAKSAMAKTGEEKEIVLEAEMVELLSELEGYAAPGDQNIIFYITGFIAAVSAKTSSARTAKTSTSLQMRYAP